MELRVVDLGVDRAVALFRPSPHLNLDRRPFQSERFPQLVDQESLVGEMERGRHVGEKDELRRLDPDLGGVEDAHLAAAGTGGGMNGGDGLDEPVQFGGRDAAQA